MVILIINEENLILLYLCVIRIHTIFMNSLSYANFLTSVVEVCSLNVAWKMVSYNIQVSSGRLKIRLCEILKVEQMCCD
jgi:hypothetical protein